MSIISAAPAETPPPSHIPPAAELGIDERQLVDHFQQLDGYGRRVALAMVATMARLKRP